MTTPVYLDLRLFPHRSLTRQQFRWLMAILAAVCVLTALRFLLVGAWPIMLFMLADLGLIYLAFRLNFRAGRVFEELRLSDQQLMVRQVDAHGRARQISIDPYWLRVELEDAPSQLSRLRLRARDRSLDIGSFLNCQEKREVKAEIEAGLSRLRARAPLTTQGLQPQ